LYTVYDITLYQTVVISTYFIILVY